MKYLSSKNGNLFNFWNLLSFENDKENDILRKEVFFFLFFLLRVF